MLEFMLGYIVAWVFFKITGLDKFFTTIGEVITVLLTPNSSKTIPVVKDLRQEARQKAADEWFKQKI